MKHVEPYRVTWTHSVGGPGRCDFLSKGIAEDFAELQRLVCKDVAVRPLTEAETTAYLASPAYEEATAAKAVGDQLAEKLLLEAVGGDSKSALAYLDRISGRTP